MVHRNIHDIELPDFLWKKAVKTKTAFPNVGFDTETISGGVFVISDSNGRTMCDSEFKDLTGLLEFLNNRNYRRTNNWFYNLEYDTNAILKYLSFEDRKFIASTNYIDHGKYRIQIIPNKELKISVINNEDKLVNTTTFFDLAQFYNFKKLGDLADTTEYSKVYVADISSIDRFKYYSNETYKQLINDRCIIDCKIAKVKADELTANIMKIVVCNNYKSKASIARKYVLENLTKNLKMPSTKLLQSALQAYHAGHIETLQMGMFKNIHNYDIKSAYPSEIAELYETSGEYLHNKAYEPDSAYSFYKINMCYESDDLSPMWHLHKNRNYHATGAFDGVWITKSEIEYLSENGYDVKILDAYHITKDSFTEQPFYNLIHDLYNERLQAKENKDEIELVYKIILNSIYGVTLNVIHKKILAEYETDLYEVRGDKLYFFEEQYKATNMYNPVYGADITAKVRSKIFRDFGSDAKDIVSINTDGVYSKVKNKVTISKQMGEYGYKKMKKIMFMGSGRYFLWEDGILDDHESKFRSIPKSATEIYALMEQHKINKTLKLSREKPIKLKESLINAEHYRPRFAKFPIQDYSIVDNFNVFRKVDKRVGFTNQTRFWYNPVSTIADLWDATIESRPFDTGELQ